jgi:diguanylate cyclase (GGDEF)-like protein
MRKRIYFLAIAFATFMLLMGFFHYFFLPKSMKNVEILDEGWDIVYNDTSYADVKLSKLRQVLGTATQKGDELILTRQLEGLDKMVSPTMRVETKFSFWEMKVNETLLLTRYSEELKNGEFVGNDHMMVTLPADPGTSILTMKIIVNEDGAYNFFDAPVLGSGDDLMRYVIFTNMFVFVSSAFLILFGLLFFAIALAFRSVVPEINMQLYSALLDMALAIWFLAQFGLLDIFVDTGGHQTEVEYVALYLTVPLLYMVMGSIHNYLHNKLFVVFASLGSAIMAVVIILHFAGIAHINRFLGLYQIDAFILFFFMVFMLIRDGKRNVISMSQIIQLAGQSMLAVAFILNVGFFYLEVANISRQIMLSKKVVPLGTLAIVFATLVNYYTYISESYARRKEYDSLTHLAYADGLTDLPNRSSYEKYLNKLEEKNDDYCVVSIDLNGLKQVNDNLGHLMGDKYLNEFSEIFRDVFGDKAFIARIGGDEFVAILEGENLRGAEELLSRISERLDELNEQDPDIKRSMAAGMAFRSELSENDGHEVYLLADERMYRQKRRMHAES